MNKEEVIEELNHHGYISYNYGSEQPDYFYIEINRRTLLSRHEVTLICKLDENTEIKVTNGDEIAYGDWYDLERDELDEYEKELNEEMKLKAGIWFEKE